VRIYWAAFFVIARLPKSAEAISGRGMRLPHTFQVLAMTKRALCRSAELTTKPDESGDYKNPERDRVLYEIMGKTINC
jgi:hypothetical protein